MLTASRISALVVLGSFLAACASETPEGTGTAQQEQVSDISSMTQRTDGRFDVVCKNGTAEVVTSEQILANQVCRSGGGGGGSANRVVIYGTTDSCDASRVVTSITPETDCNTLSDSQSAWSVSVGGRCVDISDTTVRKACLSNQPGRTLIYGTSDSCDDSRIVASITDRTDCSTLSDSTSAWSVKVNGQCIDISDTTVRKACMGNQPGRTLIYGSTDSCDDSRIVASVGPDTDCNTLSDSTSAWSVKVNGQCIDISDTTVRKACIVHAP